MTVIFFFYLQWPRGGKLHTVCLKSGITYPCVCLCVCVCVCVCMCVFASVQQDDDWRKSRRLQKRQSKARPADMDHQRKSRLEQTWCETNWNLCLFFFFLTDLVVSTFRTWRWRLSHPGVLVTSSRETVTLFFMWVLHWHLHINDTIYARVDGICANVSLQSVCFSISFARSLRTGARANPSTSTTG